MNLKRFCSAFTLANLVFLSFWLFSTFEGRYFTNYYLKFYALSAVTWIGLFALGLYWLLGVKSLKKLHLVLYTLLFLILLRNAKGFVHYEMSKGWGLACLVTGVVLFGCLCVYAYRKRQNAVIKSVQVALMLTFPFALVHFGSFLFHGVVPSNLAKTKEIQPIGKAPRIFWLVFDELDPLIAFEKPFTDSFSLPGIERMKQESVDALCVTQPQRHTLYSIPSLLTGRQVESIQFKGLYRANARYKSGETVDLKAVPNIFQTGYACGYNSAVIGWHFKYDRMFLKDLAYCSQDPFQAPHTTYPQCLSFQGHLMNFGKSMGHMLIRFFHYYTEIPLKKLRHSHLKPSILWEGGATNEYRTQTWFSSLLEKIDDVVRSPELNFAFLHLPFPHYPTFYNPSTGEIETFRKGNYYDNLKLFDKVFDDFRTKLLELGIWDSSVVIVTSDHELRESQIRGFGDDQKLIELVKRRKHSYVPCIVKMPGQKERIEVDNEFNAVALAGLVEGIMEGSIVAPQHAAEYFKNAS